jgi:predicted small lipoprotein YifL
MNGWLVLICAFSLYACGDGVNLELPPSGEDAVAASDNQRPLSDTAPRLTASFESPQLVDSSFIPATEQEAAGYRQTATADLDGDSTDETVVLVADVEMIDGRPAWDDGQRWRAYVEGADSTRTHFYARRLQLGTLTMRIARNEGGDGFVIVLIEHLPDWLALFEIEYAGPDDVTTTERFRRALDPRGDIASPRFP